MLGRIAIDEFRCNGHVTLLKSIVRGIESRNVDETALRGQMNASSNDVDYADRWNSVSWERC